MTDTIRWLNIGYVVDSFNNQIVSISNGDFSRCLITSLWWIGVELTRPHQFWFTRIPRTVINFTNIRRTKSNIRTVVAVSGRNLDGIDRYKNIQWCPDCDRLLSEIRGHAGPGPSLYCAYFNPTPARTARCERLGSMLLARRCAGRSAVTSAVSLPRSGIRH